MREIKLQNGSKERHSLIPAVHLFLIRDGKILLLRRYNTGFEDGNYSIPAGHIEENEPATTALIRESKEEIGVNLSFENMKFCGIMHRKELDEERIDLFFSAEKWDGEIKIMEPEKCDDLSWFALDNLPENLVPYVKVAIEAFNSGVLYTEFGWESNLIQRRSLW